MDRLHRPQSRMMAHSGFTLTRLRPIEASGSCGTTELPPAFRKHSWLKRKQEKCMAKRSKGPAVRAPKGKRGNGAQKLKQKRKR